MSEEPRSEVFARFAASSVGAPASPNPPRHRSKE
jgi:hypothetical protein